MKKFIIVSNGSPNEDQRLRITANDGSIFSYNGNGPVSTVDNKIGMCLRTWEWQELLPDYAAHTSEIIKCKGSLIFEISYWTKDVDPNYDFEPLPYVVAAKDVIQFFESQPNLPVTVSPAPPGPNADPDVYAFQFIAKTRKVDFTVYAADSMSSVETLIGQEYGTIALNADHPTTGVYGILVPEPPVEQHTTLLDFEVDSTLGQVRVGAASKDKQGQVSYIKNEADEIVKTLTDNEMVSLPTGRYTLTMLPSEILADSATFNDVSATACYEGLTKVNAFAEIELDAVYITSAAYPSTNLINVPANKPVREYGNTMANFFSGAEKLNDPNIALWDVSSVSDFSNAFRNCTAFNVDISGWNVRAGRNFSGMFENTANFQAPIGIWNMEYASNLSGMFRYSGFNQPIGNWDVGRVTDLSGFISEAEAFSQDLTRWCVSSITTIPTGWDWRNLMTPELSPVWGTCPFRGVSLLKFTSTRDDVRVKLTSSAGVEQRTYIVNTATGQQASSIVGSTVIIVGAGDWTLYCKEDTLTVPVSDLVLQVTGDGLTHVHEWSKQPIGEMSLYNQSQSYGTSPNLIKVPAVRPNSTQTSFNSFLNGASRFNDPSISEWDMSGVTNLVGFFGYCTVFDQSLANWDTSEVLYMADMFRGAKAFNQPLDTWDVSKVRNMSGLFRETNLFNQPLDSWNTGSATNMEYMFAETMSFNQPLDNWDVSNVTTMRRMFWFASAFDQPLPSWKVGNVTDMEDMFSGTPDYDYDLSMWCVTNITSRPPGFRDRQGALILDPVWGTCPNSTKPPTDPTGMPTPYTFKTASTAFNASSSDPFAVTVQGVRHDAVLVDTTYTLTDIASAVGDIITVEPADYAVGYTSVITLTAQPSEIINWSDFHWGDKVVGVQPSLRALLKVPTTAPLTRNFEGLLKNAVLYLGADVTNWDTSEVTNFKQLFQGCNKFVGEIGGWVTSKVTSFANLFTYCREFNGDITGWDTSSVTTLEMMLLDTRKFNQPIGSWNVSKVTNMNNMIYNGWAMAADLSQWCVSLIPTEPTGFILSANQLAGKPVWGTCPNGS